LQPHAGRKAAVPAGRRSRHVPHEPDQASPGQVSVGFSRNGLPNVARQKSSRRCCRLP
jgi:hypothetical protein